MKKRMRRSLEGSRAAVLVLSVLFGTGVASAQDRPHAGYVYPAGGARGTTFDLLVGGQHLAGTRSVWFSGQGVEAQVIRYTPALGRKEAGELRRKLIDLLRKRRRARAKSSDSSPTPGEPVLFQGTDLSTRSSADLEALYRKYFNAKKQPNAQIAEEVALRVTIDPDAPSGAQELRLLTRWGLTDPVRFEVGSWSEVTEEESTRGEGQLLDRTRGPLVVNGRILPGEVDRYRIDAAEGESLVVRVEARSLIPYLADAVPGWFQAVLTVRDATGREVARSDDFRFDPDPLLHFAVPDSGTYLIEVRDAIYRGREDFVYRMTVGQLPVVTGVFPLGARAGTRPHVSLEGWNLPVDRLIVGEGPLDVGRHWLALESDQSVSNRVPFVVGELPECLEEEPDDQVKTGQRLSLPMVVNGRIDSAGDEDVYRFRGRARQVLVAEVNARRLGSPLDSLLWLSDAKGRILARDDDHEDRGAGLVTHQADSYLMVTLPHSGTYSVHLADLQNHGGAAYTYRLHLGPPRPDFELRMVPSAINLRPGGTLPVTVHVLRRDGFSDEIKLALEGDTAGLVLGGARVPPGQDRVSVTLTAPVRGLTGPQRIRLVGRAQAGGRELRREALGAEEMMQAFINLHLVTASGIIVAPVPAARSQMPLAILGRGPVSIQPGGTAQVRIRGPRRPPPGKVTLELMEGPPGLAIDEVSPIQRTTTLTLRAGPDLGESDWAGNLIVGVFLERSRAGADAKKRPRTRRIALGTLPAIPCEIAKK